MSRGRSIISRGPSGLRLLHVFSDGLVREPATEEGSASSVASVMTVSFTAASRTGSSGPLAP
jgi:hypothetical protein